MSFGYGLRASPWGVLPFDCVRKRFIGFNRFKRGLVRRQILRLSSHCFAFTFSNIRHFTPLRMTKCAAEYKS